MPLFGSKKKKDSAQEEKEKEASKNPALARGRTELAHIGIGRRRGMHDVLVHTMSEGNAMARKIPDVSI